MRYFIQITLFAGLLALLAQAPAMAQYGACACRADPRIAGFAVDIADAHFGNSAVMQQWEQDLRDFQSERGQSVIARFSDQGLIQAQRLNESGLSEAEDTLEKGQKSYRDLQEALREAEQCGCDTDLVDARAVARWQTLERRLQRLIAAEPAYRRALAQEARSRRR